MEIKDVLVPDRVIIDANLASKKVVLEKLAGMLSGADSMISSSTVFSSLLARERLGTTGLGEGIAIPHGRVASSGRSIGAFLKTETPIDFDAVDSVPVDIFFGLCVPEDATDEHLHLLAGLANRFSDLEFIQHLRASASPADVYEKLVESRK